MSQPILETKCVTMSSVLAALALAESGFVMRGPLLCLFEIFQWAFRRTSYSIFHGNINIWKNFFLFLRKLVHSLVVVFSLFLLPSSQMFPIQAKKTRLLALADQLPRPRSLKIWNIHITQCFLYSSLRSAVGCFPLCTPWWWNYTLHGLN